MTRILQNIAWLAIKHRADWLYQLIYRYRCPRPIDGYESARACFEAGHCGCNNQDRFK